MAKKITSKGKAMKPGAKFNSGAYGTMLQSPVTVKGAGKKGVRKGK